MTILESIRGIIDLRPLFDVVRANPFTFIFGGLAVLVALRFMVSVLFKILCRFFRPLRIVGVIISAAIVGFVLFILAVLTDGQLIYAFYYGVFCLLFRFLLSLSPSSREINCPDCNSGLFGRPMSGCKTCNGHGRIIIEKR